uniref:Uncharacterized protein n=1 Tax=Meloidogyne incognita TaxID=6306 RepID=A0A914MWB6_MELIC
MPAVAPSRLDIIEDAVWASCDSCRFAIAAGESINESGISISGSFGRSGRAAAAGPNGVGGALEPASSFAVDFM